MLPDILEPAFHPNHRQFFHSLTFGIAVGLAVNEAYRWEAEEPEQKLLRYILLAIGGAYLVHLAVDAVSNRSLPLLGRM